MQRHTLQLADEARCRGSQRRGYPTGGGSLPLARWFCSTKHILQRTRNRDSRCLRPDEPRWHRDAKRCAGAFVLPAGLGARIPFAPPGPSSSVLPRIVRGINSAQLDHLSVGRSHVEPELMAFPVRVGLRGADLHPFPSAQDVRGQGCLGRRLFSSGKRWQVFGHVPT